MTQRQRGKFPLVQREVRRAEYVRFLAVYFKGETEYEVEMNHASSNQSKYLDDRKVLAATMFPRTRKKVHHHNPNPKPNLKKKIHERLD